MTNTPTPHQLLEVSAAIGADTGKWKHAYSVWHYLQPDNNGEIQRWEDYEATPDELDAQVGRLVKRLLSLYIQPEDFGEWFWTHTNTEKPALSWEIHHDDYSTAVYLAACKVRDSK